MRILVLVCALMVLSSCVNTAQRVYVPLNTMPYAIDTATIVVYYPATVKQGPLQRFELMVDGANVGDVIAEQPLRFSLKPGNHVLQAKIPGVLSKQYRLDLQGGLVYFFKLRRKYGTFVDQVHLDATPLIEGYSIISHRPEFH
ncbi:hypothetical protein [Desulfuromonas acetoxidans]|uniref:hypothetical protein n=1 Tax=Desulfuromonas acetoxidans TaxID=891 RepID=UPI00292D2F70|nr:hypothetical protein [Desulfuromonas acetoxidans]